MERENEDMKIKEFRIVMPLTLEEFERGQTYSVCEMSRNATGGGDGVEILDHQPFQDHPLFDGQFHSGQYTFKKYFMRQKVNSFVRSIAPKGSLEFEESAWNAFPYCRTVIKNDAYMKDNFEIRIESLHVANDKGDQHNVHRLDEDTLRKRQVVFIDIADERLGKKSKDQRNEDDDDDEDDKVDFQTFKSTLTGRGPLGKNWKNGTDTPFMCCYKLVSVKFKWWGIQNIVEDMLLHNQQRIFEQFHRSVFLWIDKWHGMSDKELESLTAATIEELSSRRQTPGVRGFEME